MTNRHGLTSHGHACCDKASSEPGRAMARCGGPGLCARCAKEANTVHAAETFDASVLTTQVPVLDPGAKQELLDKQQAYYMMVTLTKLRFLQRVSRAEVAAHMGVPVERIHDFDERKTPWQSISWSFLQRYARAVGTNIHVVFSPSSAGISPVEGWIHGDPPNKV